MSAPTQVLAARLAAELEMALLRLQAAQQIIEQIRESDR